MNTYIHIYIYVLMYMYLYRERDKEREADECDFCSYCFVIGFHEPGKLFFAFFLFCIVQKCIKGKLGFYIELEIKCLIYTIEKILHKSGLFSTNIY